MFLIKKYYLIKKIVLIKIYLKLLKKLGFLKEGFWWGFVAAATISQSQT